MMIYISTKYQEIDIFNKAKQLCEKLNHNIICDWTKHKPYKEISREECKKQASEDLEGINKCDVFILIYNGIIGTGMSFELGYAMAQQKQIIVVDLIGDIEEKSMFISLISKNNIVTSFDDLKKLLEVK